MGFARADPDGFPQTWHECIWECDVWSLGRDTCAGKVLLRLEANE